MYAIEYFHVAHGMEWWAAIVATTVAMRVVALPLTVMQQKNAARMHLAKPKSKPSTNWRRRTRRIKRRWNGTKARFGKSGKNTTATR